MIWRKRFLVGKHKRLIFVLILLSAATYNLFILLSSIFHNISHLLPFNLLWTSAMPKVSIIQLLFYSYAQQSLDRPLNLNPNPVPESRPRRNAKQLPLKESMSYRSTRWASFSFVARHIREHSSLLAGSDRRGHLSGQRVYRQIYTGRTQ
jgi:hypothetical protein